MIRGQRKVSTIEGHRISQEDIHTLPIVANELLLGLDVVILDATLLFGIALFGIMPHQYVARMDAEEYPYGFGGPGTGANPL